MRAPIAIPGIKPAANDLPLKSDSPEDDEPASWTGAPLAVVGEGVEVLVLCIDVADEVVVEEGSELGAVGLLAGGVGATSATHCPFSQSYPMGQQAVPHDFSFCGGSACNWVIVVFWRLMSHEMGLIWPQVLP